MYRQGMAREKVRGATINDQSGDFQVNRKRSVECDLSLTIVIGASDNGIGLKQSPCMQVTRSNFQALDSKGSREGFRVEIQHQRKSAQDPQSDGLT